MLSTIAVQTRTEEDGYAAALCALRGGGKLGDHLARLRACLAQWDCWCADDGRPAYALAAAEHFVATPCRATFRRLQRADRALQASLVPLHKVLPCYPAGPVSWLAALTAVSLHTLCTSILLAYSSAGLKAARYRNALRQSQAELETLLAQARRDL
jgi:hypothetical protein